MSRRLLALALVLLPLPAAATDDGVLEAWARAYVQTEADLSWYSDVPRSVLYGVGMSQRVFGTFCVRWNAQVEGGTTHRVTRIVFIYEDFRTLDLGACDNDCPTQCGGWSTLIRDIVEPSPERPAGL